MRNQRGCLETRRDGLSHGYVARNDRAIDRRDDVGVVEIDLCRVEHRLALLDRGFVEGDLRQRLIVRALGNVEGILRHGVCLNQSREPSQVDLGIGQRCLVLLQLRFRDGEIRLRLIDDALIRARIDLGARLSAFDLRIVIAGQFLNHAGYIGSDDDRQLGVDRAGGADAAGDRADRHGRRHIANCRAAANGPPDADDCGDKQDRRDRADSPARKPPPPKNPPRRRRPGRRKKRNFWGGPPPPPPPKTPPPPPPNNPPKKKNIPKRGKKYPFGGGKM